MKVQLPCRLSVLTPQGHLVESVVSGGQQIWKELSNFYFLSVASDVIIHVYNQPVLTSPGSNADSFMYHFFFKKKSSNFSHVTLHMILCVHACVHFYTCWFTCMLGSLGGKRLMSAIFNYCPPYILRWDCSLEPRVHALDLSGQPACYKNLLSASQVMVMPHRQPHLPPTQTQPTYVGAGELN